MYVCMYMYIYRERESHCDMSFSIQLPMCFHVYSFLICLV